MIAWYDDETTETIIARGEWRIIQTHGRDDLERIAGAPLPDESPQVKGFRTPPINPAKRIRSPKRKKR